MTISTTTRRDSFPGDDSVAVRNTTFRVYDSSQIKIYLLSDAAPPVETLLTEGIHYTVALAADLPSLAAITPDSNIVTGTNWVAYRDMPNTQVIPYGATDVFPRDAHEQSIDEHTMETQDNQDSITRALRAHIIDTDLDMEIPRKDLRRLKYLGFDTDGYPAVYTGAEIFAGGITQNNRNVRAPAVDGDIDMVLPAAGARPGFFLSFDNDGLPLLVAVIDPSTLTLTAYWVTLLETIINNNTELLAEIGAMPNVFTTEGDIVQAGTAAAPERLGIGSEGEVATVVGGKVAWASAGGTGNSPNTLINANFRFWEHYGARALSIQDLQMFPDRWKYFADWAGGTGDELSCILDNGGIWPTEEASFLRHGVFWWMAGASKKAMLAQVVSYQNCATIREAGVFSYAIDLKLNYSAGGVSAREDLIVGILRWNNGVTNIDILPDDWIPATWGATGVEPTWDANFDLIDQIDCSSLPNNGIWTTFKSENVTIPSGIGNETDNLAFIVLNNSNSYTGSNQLFMRNARLVAGPTVSDVYVDRTYEEDRALCQAYYAKTFAAGIVPSGGQGKEGALLGIATGSGDAQDSVRLTWRFPMKMRTTPTITLHNPSHSDTVNTLYDETIDDGTRTLPTIWQTSNHKCDIYTFSCTNTNWYIIHAEAKAEI